MSRIKTTAMGLLLTLCVCFLISCESLRIEKEREPLPVEKNAVKRPTLAPDAVVFDALIAHIPYNSRELARELWNDVDEQELDQNVRRALNAQGFRAGLIGASPPDSLTKILALKGKELRSSVEEEIDYSKVESTLAPISFSKPINLRAGMKSSIEMRSDVVPAIPILEKDASGALRGKTYADASPIFTVAIEQSPDGSVLFDVAPFLRYGEPRQVTRYQHGQLVRTQERPTKSFDNLRFSLSLRPGQFLVLGAADSKTNALGRYFFTEGGEDFEQTILVLRLLVTQHDGQFDRFPSLNELANGDADDSDDAETSQEEPTVDFDASEPRASADATESADDGESGGFGNYFLPDDLNVPTDE